MKWHKFSIRPATKEEYKADPNYDFKLEGEIPLHGEDVLISYDGKIHANRWFEYSEGAGGFRNLKVVSDNMYWASMPEIPTETNYIEIPIRLLREYIDNNYIHMPTDDTHVGYNRALGDLRNWLRVLEQETDND